MRTPSHSLPNSEKGSGGEPLRARRRSPSTPLLLTPFALANPAQGLTTTPATEMLIGRAGCGHEELIAARTVAGMSARFFRKRSCALALARRWVGRGRQLTLLLTLPVTPALLPATFLAG